MKSTDKCSCYTAALSSGVAFGIILSGLITIHNDWRTIYYIATALIGTLTVLVFFTMPETSFNRSPAPVPTPLHETSKLYDQDKPASSHVSRVDTNNEEAAARVQQYKKRTYIQNLKIFSGTLTTEPIWKIFVRPLAFLILPPVLWATLVMAVTIGFLVAISSNFASAFQQTYGFEPYQSGLCFIAGIVGSLLGIFAGGWCSDWTANFLTRRNNGIREPEMRLPSMTLGLIASPLALILYGVGIQNKLHWMVPTLGLGLRKFCPWKSQSIHELMQDSHICRNSSYQCFARLYHRRVSAGCW
jgi:hypothetical protein